ncbi:MAG TPA: tRNA lysidine(34) synthetase TilS [Gemmatimonadaceae bacterium]|nr:tRNA lysidine(34) synthetase TilS [Gemmatimonadaceae bacterium]
MASLLAEGGRFVLAVSGGVDSMVLLHAAATACPTPEGAQRLVVATFDHGTGAHARDAVAHVRRWATAWGLRVVARAADRPIAPPVEAAWRAARWDFLREVAADHGARVVTAHTLDDQLETVVMRAMRGAGARGLSALRAPSNVRRPLLPITREEVLAYAAAHAVAWVDDPGNASRAHLRNRVRLDLLPALTAADPSFGDAMLALADRAAALRAECSSVVARQVLSGGPGWVVARQVTDERWEPRARALYWQTVADRAGIALDWRGTDRLARFAASGRGGTRIPLSGGYEAVHRREAIEIRRRRAVDAGSVVLRPGEEARFGPFRFRSGSAIHPMRGGGGGGMPWCAGSSTASGEEVGDQEGWSAWLPADATLEVRAWRAGDRMDSSGGAPRRVKRFLADRRVAAADREGWPVVVADGEIVWIPGVRRGHAATVRSGRPRVCFLCERLRP